MSIADHLIRPAPARASAQRSGLADAACELVDLLDVPVYAWAALAERAGEPNIFFGPDWARAVARHVDGKSGAKALLAWDGPRRGKLVGLLPVISSWRALRAPLPAFVAWQSYAPLMTPLLDRECMDDAACGLLRAAQRAGAFALVVPMMATQGPVAAALRRAASDHGTTRELNAHSRAFLDTTRNVLDALGAKKRKELRRQRHRLADMGEVSFHLHDGAEAITALDDFLALESQGWKGAKGTALNQNEGDRAFMREASTVLIEKRQAQVATLACGEKVVAAGILLRHQRRGYFFKIAYDETCAKFSPGVQLTLEMTRAMADDAHLDGIDSLASANHSMIDSLWHDRLAVGDLVLPVQRDGMAVAAIGFAVAAHAVARNVVKYGLQSLRRFRR